MTRFSGNCTAIADPLLARAAQLAMAFLIGIATAITAAAAAPVEQLKKLSLDELMELEVTSVLRAPVALAKAPSALQVITNWDIRRSGASSLPEALRLANNLNVARKNAHDWGISARGFNAELANKLLVMIDGRAVYTPLWSGVRWDVQDTLLEDVDRIEVISGPGGSVWGANAVNGIINVTTKSAEHTQGFFAEAGFGDQLEHAQAFRYGGVLAPGVFFRVYAKRFERDDEAFTDGRPAGDASRLGQTGFRLDAGSPSQGALTVQGDYYTGIEGVVGAGAGKVAGGNVLSRWSKELSDEAGVRLQFYYDRAFLRLPVASGQLGRAGRFTDDLDTYDLDFQHHFQAHHRHAVLWGLGYRRIEDRSTPAPALGFDPARHRQNLLSGFIQDQVALTPGRVLTVGTKIERTHYTGWEVEPSVRIQQELSSRQMIWGAISRAVRTPSRVDRDIRQPTSGTAFLQGNDAFDSESLLAYELGIRSQVGPRLAGSLSAFYNDYRDLRSIRPSPGGTLPYTTANDLEAQTTGVEFSFDADLQQWWRLYGGYSALRGGVRVRAGGIDVNNALNETSDPRNQLALGSSFELFGRAELDLHLRWVDTLETHQAGQPRRVPSYLDLNLRVAIRLSENSELALVGQNLLDNQHLEYWSQGAEPVEIRRSVFAKLSWRY